MSKVFDINGKKVNLGKVLPLRIKDWKELKAQHGIDPTDLAQVANDFDQVVKMCSYIFKKANADVTDEDIDSLTMDELFGMFSSSIESREVEKPT